MKWATRLLISAETHQEQAWDDEEGAAAEQGEDARHQEEVPDWKKGQFAFYVVHASIDYVCLG